MGAEAIARPKAPMARGESRRGFALFVAVIVIAVIAVLGTVVMVTLSGNNDQDRIEKTADVLHRLVAAMDTVRTTTGSSFGGMVGTGKYPFKLSQLTHRISTNDLNCGGVAGTAYLNGDVSSWRGPYYLVPIPTTGFQIAPGFFANNQLVKVATTDLAIQMDNVSLADAKALELFVEKKNTGAGPVVTFSTASDPTSVRYHLITTGTNICS